jgi:ubiquitin fusion degradation protein 1
MLFQVENDREGRSTHCGVLEFIADEGMVYLPYWMMQNLLLQEGDVITLRSATLPKGTFVKLQPHSTDFLDISNPRAVLETTLRNFSCLTVGDTIPINYNNRQYFIDIVEAKPAAAISVIETDCNVDFAPPLDYVEPEPVFGNGAGGSGSASMATAATAATAAVPMMTDSGSIGGGGNENAGGAAVMPEEPTFLAFAGTGRRLDGKAASESVPVAIPRSKIGLPVNGSGAASGQEGASGSVPKSGSAPGRKAGKLMFKDRLAAKFGDGKTPGAGGAGGSAAAAAKPKEEEKPKEPENAFKAFQGTSHKLK